MKKKDLLLVVGAVAGVIAVAIGLYFYSGIEEILGKVVEEFIYGSSSTNVDGYVALIRVFALCVLISMVISLVKGVQSGLKLAHKEPTNTPIIVLLVGGIACLILVLPYVFTAFQTYSLLNDPNFGWDSLMKLGSYSEKLYSNYKLAFFGVVIETVCLGLPLFLKEGEGFKLEANVNIDLSGVENAATNAYTGTVNSLKNKAENENKAVEGITPSEINMELVLQTLQYHLYQVKYLKPVLPYIEYIFIALAFLMLFNYSCFWVMVLSGILAFVCRKYNGVALGVLFVVISYIMDIKYHTSFATFGLILSNISYYSFVCLSVYGLYKYTQTDSFKAVKAKLESATQSKKPAPAAEATSSEVETVNEEPVAEDNSAE